MQAPSIGRIVIVRTLPSNGSNLHPGIITRVWGANMVNVKVFPDVGAPYDETSISLHDSDADGEVSPTANRFCFWPPKL